MQVTKTTTPPARQNRLKGTVGTLQETHISHISNNVIDNHTRLSDLATANDSGSEFGDAEEKQSAKGLWLPKWLAADSSNNCNLGFRKTDQQV